MAIDEGLLQGSGNGEDLEALKSSIGRISSLLQANKAARKWRRNSSKHSSREEPGNLSWRIRLGEALDSTAAHVIIVALLLIDLLATAIDLLLTIHNKNSELSKCSVLLQACVCESEFDGNGESWEFLHWISVGILCVLMANILGLMVAFGAAFFKHAGYVLDLFVVTTALVLEVCFEADTAGLLIILNLWRIVRVAHGIFEVTDEAWENELDDMKEKLEGAENTYKQQCRWKDQKILELEAEINDLKGTSS